MEGIDGNLYGTTLAGGTDNYGVVFKLSPKGLTVLHNFRGLNGAYPYVGMVQATDGNLYGVAARGGTLRNGVIFRISANGYSVLYDFDGVRGQYPVTQLLQHTNGKLYGMTNSGGASGYGVIYSFDLGLSPFVGFVVRAAPVGRTAQMLGQGFIGTTKVSFNGTAATFVVNSDTFLTATVPTGATNGFVTVTTPSGTLTSNVPFHVLP